MSLRSAPHHRRAAPAAVNTTADATPDRRTTPR
jgi:hypothetical protein